MKKRLLAVVLLGAMVASLAACGSSETASSAASSAAASEAKSEAEVAASSAAASSVAEASTAATGESKGLICYANKGVSYYAWTVMQEAGRVEAEARGYDYEVSDAKLDSAKQFDQYVNFINKQPAAIIADSIDSEGLIAANDQARAAGIPTAISDTPLTGGDVNVTVAFDNYEAGIMAADSIAKALTDKFGKAEGTVFNCYGAMSSEAWRLRKEGMEAEFAEKYPDVNYIALPCEGDIALTQDAIQTQIAAGVIPDACHTPSDNPGMGIVAALKSEDMWYTKDDPNHVIVVNIDGEPISTKYIKEGYYDYCIAQDCYCYGAICVEMLDEYSIQGEEVPLGTYENDMYYWEKCEIIDSDSGPYVKTPCYEINPENVDDPRHWAHIAEDQLGINYDMSATEV